MRGESAVGQQFLKASQPAQATRIARSNQRRVNGAPDRRQPAEVEAVTVGLPESHATCGEDRHFQAPVVEFDDIDPVARSAADGPFFDRRHTTSIVVSDGREGGGLDPKLIDPDCGVRIGQNRRLFAHRGSS